MNYRLGLGLAATLSLAIGCGGTVVASDGELGPGSDAGHASDSADAHTPPDGAKPPDASKPPDGSNDSPIIISDTSVVDKVVVDSPPEDFCSGDSPKALVNGSVVTAPLTTSLLIMDCCDGAYVTFHTKDDFGFNIQVMMRWFGMVSKGSYVLGDEPGGIEVSVNKMLGDWGSSSEARGTLHVDTSYPEPLLLGLCIETEADSSLGATRLYVPQVLVAPFDWQNRFGLYLLSDTSMTAETALKLPLASVSIASEPTIHLMSIDYYEQSTNKGYWDSWHSTEGLLAYLPEVGVFGLPFVVVADGERVYMGAFMTQLSSFMVNAPSIMIESMTKEGFEIEPPPSAPDPRSDPRILKVLSTAQKLAP